MTRRAWFLFPAILALLLLNACAFQRDADDKFGDQNFKTAIALIELHKVRFGAYPDSLQELKFVGEWDKIPLSSVQYRKVADGYELDVTRGWVATPEGLSYPPEFWRGLGLVKSNMGFPSAKANGGG